MHTDHLLCRLATHSKYPLSRSTTSKPPQASITPPNITPATATTPETKEADPKEGPRPKAPFSALLAPELADPVALSVAEALEVAASAEAELEVALALTLALADPLEPEAEAEAEEVALPPPIPGRSSKETSRARSPHRSSRAGSSVNSRQGEGGEVRAFVEWLDVGPAGVPGRQTHISRIKGRLTRRNNVGHPLQTVQSSRNIQSRSYLVSLLISSDGANVPCGGASCTSSFVKTVLLALIPLYTTTISAAGGRSHWAYFCAETAAIKASKVKVTFMMEVSSLVFRVDQRGDVVSFSATSLLKSNIIYQARRGRKSNIGRYPYFLSDKGANCLGTADRTSLTPLPLSLPVPLSSSVLGEMAGRGCRAKDGLWRPRMMKAMADEV